jgi:hypothetical protein
MQPEAEFARPPAASRSPHLFWWHVVLIVCAVVVALSSLVIASAVVHQARYLRQANCAARAQAGGTEAKNQGDLQDDAIRAELRRCLGLPKQP